MKVAIVIFSYDSNIGSEEELLRRYYTVTGFAEALQRSGTSVAVFTRFHRDASMERNQVEYHFVKDRRGERFNWWQIPMGFMKQVAACNPDVVHLHELTLSVPTLIFRSLLPKKTAIILQHHGGMTRHDWKTKIHNRLIRAADGYFFTAIEQGRDWFQNSRQASKVMPVMEGASFFNFDSRDRERNFQLPDRPKARQHTGMQGEPVFLWVARLDQNKDPLTVLAGFEHLLDLFPKVNLYMIYESNTLEKSVQEKIERSLKLKDHVRLKGKIPHDQLIHYYESAEYFVMGSHYEGSSYALSEALSCGCIPIVTNIPSLHAMTNNGQLGALWKPGDKDSFVEAAKAALSKSVTTEGNACINFYKENLSFDAIASRALQYYRKVITGRK